MINKSNSIENAVENKSRYMILTLLFLGWCVGNLNRFSINYAILEIGKDFDLSASTQGFIMSSFFLGYALMQIPGGWLADRYGPKKVLISSILVWSIFASLSGVAWSASVLILFRFLLGLSLGAFYPTALKTIAQVFPRNEQGKAISILLVSGVIIAVVSSIFFAWIIGIMGWQVLFHMIAALGVVIAVFYLMILKLPERTQNKIDDHFINEPQSLAFRQILKVPFVWSMCVVGFCVSLITWGINSWVPTYLVQVRHLSLMTAGKWQMMPAVLGLLAMLASGIIADKLKTNTVKQLAMVMSILTAFSVFMMYRVSSLTLFFIFEGITIACVTAIFVIINSLIMKQFSSEVTGSVVGLVNFGSQAGSFTAPFIIGIIVDANKGSFDMIFLFLTVIAVISIIAFLTIFSKRSLRSNVTCIFF
ncbi:MFS transporter [Fusibacter ferrireducens]|uniref:MFS transporter n=1 Tax=Fusibacter ferrireducens TaxID=2785058 RepID=A0ABR9ZY81_9FIRM|nr:MFS transporter [Fusibacter ferrireducens]MBF4694534.1 MFS transporter [Fusibacter ferrireducens]